jgi:hypothetical protein
VPPPGLPPSRKPRERAFYQGNPSSAFFQRSPKPRASRAQREDASNDKKASRHDRKEQTDNSNKHESTAEGNEGDPLKWFLRPLHGVPNVLLVRSAGWWGN